MFLQEGGRVLDLFDPLMYYFLHGNVFSWIAVHIFSS